MMALAAIRSSKLRSVLTMLGIVVGIFSIISVMTALSVLRNSIEQGMTQLGANTFQVQKFSMDFNTTPEQRRRMRNRKNITYEQALQVRDKATLALSVGIEGSEGGRSSTGPGGRPIRTSTSTERRSKARRRTTGRWPSARGLTAQDLDMARPVAVLDPRLRRSSSLRTSIRSGRQSGWATGCIRSSAYTPKRGPRSEGTRITHRHPPDDIFPEVRPV